MNINSIFIDKIIPELTTKEILERIAEDEKVVKYHSDSQSLYINNIKFLRIELNKRKSKDRKEKLLKIQTCL